MDQYPDHAGLDSNYSYNFGIFSTCQPGDRYVRAYDQETKYIRMDDCKGCAGCDASEPKNSNDSDNTKENFTPKQSPLPQQHYYTPMTFTPHNSGNTKNDDKFNIVIVILLAFIVVILLINNSSSRKEQQPQIKYILVSKDQLSLK